MQGVDVWLNNPRRPLEASGTSGQKVVLNGGLNLSVLDGWWAEAYDGLNGFAIGAGGVIPTRGPRAAGGGGAGGGALRGGGADLLRPRPDGLPREWIARMKRAIRTLGWRFSADRMVMDYVLKSYVPAAGGTSSDVREGCPPSPVPPVSGRRGPGTTDGQRTKHQGQRTNDGAVRPARPQSL